MYGVGIFKSGNLELKESSWLQWPFLICLDTRPFLYCMYVQTDIQSRCKILALWWRLDGNKQCLKLPENPYIIPSNPCHAYFIVPEFCNGTVHTYIHCTYVCISSTLPCYATRTSVLRMYAATTVQCAQRSTYVHTIDLSR